MRAGVREVLPSPVTAPALEAAVSRVAAKLAGAPSRKIGKILAFMPCKGGAGATFLATNLGWQLAETKSVLLIDLNLQFGDALSFVHDGTAPSTLADVAKEIAGWMGPCWRPAPSRWPQLQHPGSARRSGARDGGQAGTHRCHPQPGRDPVRLRAPGRRPLAGHHRRQGAGPRLAHLPRAAVQPARPAQRGQAAGSIQVAGLSAGEDRADHQPLRQERRHRHRPGTALAGQRAAEHDSQLLPGSERIDQPRRPADQHVARKHGGQAAGRFCRSAEPASGRNAAACWAGFSGGHEHEQHPTHGRAAA